MFDNFSLTSGQDDARAHNSKDYLKNCLNDWICINRDISESQDNHARPNRFGLE